MIPRKVVLFQDYELKKPGRSNPTKAAEVYQQKLDTLRQWEANDELYYVGGIAGVFLAVMVVVSAGNYSGYQKPPMHGDFEAQRHWMEISIHLPVKEWYMNTTQNDLNYWGLDYPPLTAYHSYLLGKISHSIHPTWVALTSSRGIEDPTHLAFMRVTVIVTMLAIYFPAVIYLLSPIKGQYSLVALAVLYPGLIFVDNGHFQYNHIALGFFLWSLYHLQVRNYLWGSFFFVLALNFKQMELYHALPIFVFLLSRSIPHAPGLSFLQKSRLFIINVLKLGIVVIATFVILWSPFLTDLTVLKQAIHRLFPFARGIFEDKVANFWCSLNVVYKIKDRFELAVLLRASTLLVLSSSLPSLYILFRRPSEKNLRTALTIGALSFYLFSFQVHEKSILMAAIPALFLLNDHYSAVSAFLDASSISMYTLCLKDENPEILVLFIVYHIASRLLADSVETTLVSYSRSLQLAISLVICSLQLFGQPPERYPHLFELFNAVFSFGLFSLFWLYLNFWLAYEYFTTPSGGGKVKKQ
uniref:Alpha-1,3-glucosyltransferase n=1 Tax=Panagrellus redivivus TaxID=6233 RepID=A0A7E4W1K7_PANRE